MAPLYGAVEKQSRRLCGDRKTKAQGVILTLPRHVAERRDAT